MNAVRRIIYSQLLATGGPTLLSATNTSGVSVLHLGAWYGFDDVVDASLSCDCDVNGRADDVYKMRWMQCRLSGKTLFPRNCDLYRPDSFFSGSQVTPLYVAARAGHDRIVRKLLAAGADINAAKTLPAAGGLYDGVTPLHAASARGHATTVRVLLDDVRCEINCRTTDGTTPLHCAVEGCHLAVVRALLDRLQPSNPPTKPRPSTTPAPLMKHTRRQAFH
jgi:ankyrin repeat protein